MLIKWLIHIILIMLNFCMLPTNRFQQIAFFVDVNGIIFMSVEHSILDHIDVSVYLPPSLGRSQLAFFKYTELGDDHPQSSIHHINHNNRDTTAHIHSTYEFMNWTAFRYVLWDDDDDDEENNKHGFLF